jgi:SnoaL-like protein
VVIDPLSSNDRVQLLEVYARSVMLLELERYTEWAGLFGPHALIRFVGTSEQSPAEFRGREELLSLGRKLMRGEVDFGLGHLTPPSRARHHLSKITLFGGGRGRASGYAFLTITTVGSAEAPRWLASGMYSDSFFRNPAGCWCFETRTLTTDAAIGPARETNSRVAGAR